jgi:hypothetical protein
MTFSLYTTKLLYKFISMSKQQLALGVITTMIILVITITTTTSALAQTTTIVGNGAAAATAITTFGMNGAISSLVLGMPPNTKTVDMTTVQKFILSGDWSMSVDKGKLASFAASFYTGPVNGGTSNHTHQISNFRVNNNNTSPIIQLGSTKSVSISGISDVGTNGNKAWNNVHTTIVISNGRTIAISLADKDTQSHFMGQKIYGIVKRLNI